MYAAAPRKITLDRRSLGEPLLPVAIMSNRATRKQAQKPMPKPILRKVLTVKQVARWAVSARHHGQRIVATNGCFDLVHFGHVNYLQRARQLGDLLVVGLNGDQSVRQLKGPGRPL